MKNNKTNGWKWVAIVLGALLILPLCLALVGGGLLVARAGGPASFRDFDRFEQRLEADTDLPDSPETPISPETPGNPEFRSEEATEFHGNHDFGGRHGHDFGGRYGNRHFGRGGFGSFGIIGGLMRLLGMVALVSAGIIFFRNRPNNSKHGDNDDDASTMTEAEIRAAMKNAGIDKIEL